MGEDAVKVTDSQVSAVQTVEVVWQILRKITYIGLSLFVLVWQIIV